MVTLFILPFSLSPRPLHLAFSYAAILSPLCRLLFPAVPLTPPSFLHSVVFSFPPFLLPHRPFFTPPTLSYPAVLSYSAVHTYPAVHTYHALLLFPPVSTPPFPYCFTPQPSSLLLTIVIFSPSCPSSFHRRLLTAVSCLHCRLFSSLSSLLPPAAFFTPRRPPHLLLYPVAMPPRCLFTSCTSPSSSSPPVPCRCLFLLPVPRRHMPILVHHRRLLYLQPPGPRPRVPWQLASIFSHPSPGSQIILSDHPLSASSPYLVPIVVISPLFFT